MSEANGIVVPMNELEKQIELARLSLAMSINNEELSGYDIDHTMDRKYNEGFVEALEFIYILQNGHNYDERND
jgi:hypothetical protein